MEQTTFAKPLTFTPAHSVAIGNAAPDWTPRQGWDMTLNGKFWHRDDVEAASDEDVQGLIDEARKEHHSILGEHVWLPAILENILLKRKVERLEEKFAKFEEDATSVHGVHSSEHGDSLANLQ